MKIFSAALAAETNTFAPMPAGISAFQERAFYPAGSHPDQMQMHSGPLWAARLRASVRHFVLAEGLVAAAVPNGLVPRRTYEALRDEILRDLQAAIPVDIVLLGLHGAMVADGYDDCEGDLLARVRAMVGPDTVIGAALDPHCHLTVAMTNHADLMICWKQYPHTDILERAEDLLDACLAMAERRLVVGVTVIDTGMITLIHTDAGAGREFIERVQRLERTRGIVSISIIHGFPWGDVADMGTRVLVYSDATIDTDGSQRLALASQLADELAAARDSFAARGLSVDEALDEALFLPGPVVLADGSDNAGGGAPSDSTFILRQLLDRVIRDACLGPLWDPGAVRIAIDAGEGAELPMRVGGKTCPLSGTPVDATWTVKHIRHDVIMTGMAGTPAKLGHCALVETAGIEVLLSTIRCQGFDTDMFTQLNCDLSTKKIIVVKSSQHFVTSYSKIASRILYVNAPGVVTANLRELRFTKVQMPRWPLSELGPLKILVHANTST